MQSTIFHARVGNLRDLIYHGQHFTRSFSQLGPIHVLGLAEEVRVFSGVVILRRFAQFIDYRSSLPQHHVVDGGVCQAMRSEDRYVLFFEEELGLDRAPIICVHVYRYYPGSVERFRHRNAFRQLLRHVRIRMFGVHLYPLFNPDLNSFQGDVLHRVPRCLVGGDFQVFQRVVAGDRPFVVNARFCVRAMVEAILF